MKNDKKPQVRFKGFNDDWEQRKLGEVFKEYSEKNHTELPALTIIQGGGTVKREESDRSLMYDESNLSNYKMVRKDDFIVHLRSFEGGLEKSLLDGIISPAYHTFHSDVADSRFYYPYFRSHEFIKHKLVPHVYGIRDGRSIDIAGMNTIEIPYTSIEEQRKIGDYLESLDHLITLHRSKCYKVIFIKEIYLGNSVSLAMLVQLLCVSEFLKSRHQMKVRFLFIRLVHLVASQMHSFQENYLMSIKINIHIRTRAIY